MLAGRNPEFLVHKPGFYILKGKRFLPSYVVRSKPSFTATVTLKNFHHAKAPVAVLLTRIEM
jgi:hypothetical protein